MSRLYVTTKKSSPRNFNDRWLWEPEENHYKGLATRKSENLGVKDQVLNDNAYWQCVRGEVLTNADLNGGFGPKRSAIWDSR